MRRGDLELDGRTKSAGERGRLEHRRLHAGVFRKVLRRELRELARAAAAFVPRLQHKAEEPVARRVHLEDMFDFGVFAQILEDRIRIQNALLQRGVGRALHKSQDEALVFLRRKFVPGEAVKKINAAEHDDGKRRRHHHHVQAGMQQALVSAAHALENVVDIIAELVLPVRSFRARPMQLEQARTHHGRKRQRHDGRDGDRAHQA